MDLNPKPKRVPLLMILTLFDSKSRFSLAFSPVSIMCLSFLVLVAWSPKMTRNCRAFLQVLLSHCLGYSSAMFLPERGLVRQRAHSQLQKPHPSIAIPSLLLPSLNAPALSSCVCLPIHIVGTLRLPSLLQYYTVHPETHYLLNTNLKKNRVLSIRPEGSQ